MRRLVFVLIVVSLPLLGLGQEDIWRVEPPNWWIGMENPELQIMIYGDGIGQKQPSVSYPGVKISRIERPENNHYLFLYLIIDPATRPGNLKIKLGDQEISYPLEKRKKGSATRVGFGPEDVIYLITPDRFANGNEENDEIQGMLEKPNRRNPSGRHGGDLKGILDHLDYIEDMGFTALWLNPVVENNMPNYSYHGYAATDFYRIDPRYGSLGDYLELSRECKKRGIKLIMDQIMNHCGSYHWWMKDLPAKDWIHGGGTYQQTTHKRVVLNDPYVAESDIKKFTDGWFVPSMPDMNQSNPLLADYLIQNSIWWVEKADLDGIRHDTHSYAGKEFMREYSCRIMNEYPDFTIVGEEWSLNPAIIAKWQRGKNNPDGYVSCMPSMFDFPLQNALSQSLGEEEDWNSGWIKVYEELACDFLYADPFMLVTFPDNHDMDRFFTQVNEDLDLYRMGIAYFLCIRGIPQIYYGTEILATNAKRGDHASIRSDFPGGWKGDQTNVFEGDVLSQDQLEALNYMKKLLNWRKTSEAVHRGKLMHYAPENGIYVFFRYYQNRGVMVAFNKSNETVSLKKSDYQEMLLRAKDGFDVINSTVVSLDNVTLPPRSVRIIEYTLQD